MQRGHALLADRVEARQGGLGAGDGVVVEVRDQAIGGLPGFLAGLADDHVQADPEAHLAALAGGLLAYLGDLLGNRRRRLAPGQVQLDLLGGEVLGGLRGAAEVQRRTRLLQRRIEELGPLHLDVLAGVVDGLALQHATPDAGEFDRRLVAFGVAQVQAVASQFVGIAAGDQVEQRAAVGQPVQGRRLARGDGRRNDPGTQRDEELQALGYRDQRGGDQPGVLAGTSGGDQYAAEAQAVGGLGDLLQVAVVDGTGALGGAQVVAVAVGGKEPENLEAHRN